MLQWALGCSWDLESVIQSEVNQKEKKITGVTPWTVAWQAPLFTEFSRPEYCVSSHSLLQGIFPNQGLNPSLLHCRWIFYHLSHQGSPDINPYMCNLEKWYRWTSMQGRNRDTDVDSRCVDTRQKGGINWEIRIDIYPLPCVNCIASVELPYSSGSSAWRSVLT